MDFIFFKLNKFLYYKTLSFQGLLVKQNEQNINLCYEKND